MNAHFVKAELWLKSQASKCLPNLFISFSTSEEHVATQFSPAIQPGSKVK